MTTAFQSLYFSLADHPPGLLSRDRTTEKQAGVYEFSRQFRKLAKSAVQFLVDLCRPSQLLAGPFLRGFYFTGMRKSRNEKPMAEMRFISRSVTLRGRTPNVLDKRIPREQHEVVEMRTGVHLLNVHSLGTRGDQRRERRRAKTRLEILRVASSVFRARGYASSGMREIALAADLSPGNLYRYFRSKDEILFFCQDGTLDRLQAVLEVARKARGPVGARLRDLAAAHVLCLIGEVEGLAAHIEEGELPQAMRAALMKKRDAYEHGVRALVASGMRHGKLRHGDATIVTRSFLGALNWTAHWFRPEGSQSAAEIAQVVADYAVGGLTGAGSRIKGNHT